MAPPSLRRLAAAALAAGAGLAAWSALVEPRWIQVRRRRVALPGLPAPLSGLRIGLVADLHAGRLTPTSTLRRAVERLDDERPDVVAVAGDLADKRPSDLDRALEVLAGLSAPLGVYVVAGNHDRDATRQSTWSRGLDAHPGLVDLTNRCVVLVVEGARLCLAGVDDLDRGEPHLALPRRSERDVTVLLAHQPDHAERVRGRGVDLVLSGHTHGGQVRLPGVGPLMRKSDVYDEGLREDRRPRVYTTRGLGSTLLPVRLGARPEVAVLELVGGGREA